MLHGPQKELQLFPRASSGNYALFIEAQPENNLSDHLHSIKESLERDSPYSKIPSQLT